MDSIIRESCFLQLPSGHRCWVAKIPVASKPFLGWNGMERWPLETQLRFPERHHLRCGCATSSGPLISGTEAASAVCADSQNAVDPPAPALPAVEEMEAGIS